MDDVKYLYETIGFLFIKSRESQNISEQFKNMLEGKQKEIQVLRERIAELENGTESEN